MKRKNALRRPRALALAAAVTLAMGIVAGPPPATAGPQGPLRTADPTLVRSGDRWVTLSSGQAVAAGMACTPTDAVWTKGFAHVPVRQGGAPGQLDDCLVTDALPDGPAAWADAAAGSVASPTLASTGTGAWRLLYSARRPGSAQRCIGAAAGSGPTGPAWTHRTTALVCPAGGSSASDPELYRDGPTGPWFLLWREDVAACEAKLRIQAFDPAAVALTGSPRDLVTGSAGALGYDDVTDGSCPGGVRHVIGSPTMVRSATGVLWLLFSANDPASTNHATGWAVCGSAPDSPAAGGPCGLVNAFDPAGRYRPMFGAPARTAPAAGATAAPYGGLNDGGSIGAPSVRADGGRVYLTAQRRTTASATPTQSVYRLDTTGAVPSLVETEVMTWYGAAGTFGTSGPTTPSGQRSATRAVPGFAWPPGRSGVFNDRAADGTLFVAGDNQDGGYGNATSPETLVGAFDPATSTWTNVAIPTTTGATRAVEPDGSPAGSSMGDIQSIDGGRAIAFTNVIGWPAGWSAANPPPDGVWPTFGIVSRGPDGRWGVQSGPGWINQWTGGQLGARREAGVPAGVCPGEWHLPAGESNCQGPNELAAFPQSKDLIVAQYLGDGAGGALMALRVTGPDAAGRYDVRVRGYHHYDHIPDNPRTPGNPADRILVAPKAVETDPTGVIGDERFTLVFDLYPTDDDGNGATPVKATPGVTQEFRYDATTGAITPVSGPFITGNPGIGEPYAGIGATQYDRSGNLWTVGDQIAVYAKGADGTKRFNRADCGFSPTRANGDYRSPVDATTAVWGQTCRPDFEILQAEPLTKVDANGNPLWLQMQLARDPSSNTMVAVNTWGKGDNSRPVSVLPVRYQGTGTGMTFAVGNVLDTGIHRLPIGNLSDSRPPVIDANGRLWWTIKQAQPPGVAPNQSFPHWHGGVDLQQLFEPAPVTLGRTAGSSTTVQAEHHASFATATRAGTGGTRLVDSAAYVRRCYNEAGCSGSALADDSGSGFTGGPVELRVWVPRAGTYRLDYQAKAPTGGSIGHRVDAGPSGTTALPASTAYGSVRGPTLANLSAGLHRITISVPPGAGGWYLDSVRLIRS